MKTRISVFSAVCLISCFLILGLVSPIAADYDYYSDRLSREHRVANEVDEWIERGNATITASPRFEDGIRLTAWANTGQNTDDYEFAIASAVYLFEIPVGTQYIEILVRYRGEPHHLEIEDYEEPIAGRAWIRNTKREATQRGYHDENASETRYGDTFVLRAKNRSERIKIPAVGHIKDGWMEMHIVAEGGEQIDVEHIEVSSYRRQPKVRVIQRYTPTYRWRPWHRYTYLYFYDGPVYYATDYDYYLRWSYPIYDHHYLSIRSYYGGYLGRYRGYYPSSYYRYYSPYYGSYYGSRYRGTPKVYQRRTRLNKWSTQHEATRRQYSRSRLAVNRRQTDRTVGRNVRTTLENHRKQTPATTERVTRQSIIAQKRRAIASTATLRQSNIRQSTYASGSTVSKQRRYPTATTQRLNRYSRETQRTTPLYRRPSTTSSSRSYSSTTRSNGSLPKYGSRVSSSSSTTRSNPSVSRSRTASTSRERTSVSRSKTTSSSRSRTSVSRSSSTKTRSRPKTSGSSVSRSSSSSSDDDDKRSSSSSSSRSRTTSKRRR